jgi:hypothetical protein
MRIISKITLLNSPKNIYYLCGRIATNMENKYAESYSIE